MMERAQVVEKIIQNIFDLLLKRSGAMFTVEWQIECPNISQKVIIILIFFCDILGWFSFDHGN